LNRKLTCKRGWFIYDKLTFCLGISPHEIAENVSISMLFSTFMWNLML
jgi:hypothetical protein